jgi:hypothetical protein
VDYIPIHAGHRHGFRDHTLIHIGLVHSVFSFGCRNFNVSAKSIILSLQWPPAGNLKLAPTNLSANCFKLGLGCRTHCRSALSLADWPRRTTALCWYDGDKFLYGCIPHI